MIANLITKGMSYIRCPFNKAHNVGVDRFVIHIHKCQKHRISEIKFCKYNQLHVYDKQHIEEHQRKCKDRVEIEDDDDWLGQNHEEMSNVYQEQSKIYQEKEQVESSYKSYKYDFKINNNKGKKFDTYIDDQSFQKNRDERNKLQNSVVKTDDF